MKEQTAVEWLIEQLENDYVNQDLKNTIVYQQAKEIEKEQMNHIVDINEMVSPQTEFSDNVLFEQATVAMEEMYGYGCETEIDAYFRGLKWMQKQFNK